MLRKAFLVCLIALLSCGLAMAQETKVDGDNPQPYDFDVLGGTGMTCYGGPPIPIPNSQPDSGITSTIDIPCPANAGTIEVLVQIQHTWVGDLEVKLTRGADSIEILDRPGLQPPTPPPGSCCGCSGNDIDATFSDNGTAAAETMCNNAPAISGDVLGGDPPGPVMAVFDGKDLCGTWELRVTDGAGGDIGSLVEWCLLEDVGSRPPVPASNRTAIFVLGALLLLGSTYFMIRRRQTSSPT